MKLNYRGRCHICRCPLDPHVIVDSMFEYLQVLAWSSITNVNVSANDRWLKILGPAKTVRMCGGCYFTQPKISPKDLILRETTGAKLVNNSPPRKTWNDAEMIDWFKRIPQCPIAWGDIPQKDRRYPFFGFIILLSNPLEFR